MSIRNHFNNIVYYFIMQIDIYNSNILNIRYFFRNNLAYICY